ncbi:uncharacterized protein LOC123466638 [Daphnia magna]|uniref:uncharacterized protein LOC123466638 n=1 Tax=Daphnia magna TaxID=35525 RepID=UPI001E1BAB6C|nr:uncharacterized protein LOC123466638 [Daphnia magna]
MVRSVKEPLRKVLGKMKLLTGRQPGATSESPDSTKMSRDDLIELDKQRSEHALTWWRLWQESYLSDLKQFHCRKGKSTRIPHVGEIVLLKEPNIKRVSWPTAIVTGVIPGTDAKVRAVVLRLRSGKETTRSIQTVYPLEVQADIDTPVDDTEIGTVEKTTSTRKKNPLHN